MSVFGIVEGRDYISLKRCNRFKHHKHLKRDGDILLEFCGNGSKDIKDGEYILKEINRMLKDYARLKKIVRNLKK